LLFHDAPFLWLLLATFVGYWWVLRSQGARNLLLLAASVVFYAHWNPWLVLLVVATAMYDYRMARAIEDAPTERARGARLVAAIAAPLGLLAYFKYTHFRDAHDLDGPRLLRGPDLLRLLGALRHGDRERAPARYHPPDQLPHALLRGEPRGVLASLAHHALDVAPRLSLHPARRESPRHLHDLPQPLAHDAAGRVVARRRVDVRRLGRLSWDAARPASGDPLARLDRPPTAPSPPGGADVPPRVCGVGALPRAEPRGSRRGPGADVRPGARTGARPGGERARGRHPWYGARRTPPRHVRERATPDTHPPRPAARDCAGLWLLARGAARTRHGRGLPLLPGLGPVPPVPSCPRPDPARARCVLAIAGVVIAAGQLAAGLALDAAPAKVRFAQGAKVLDQARGLGRAPYVLLLGSSRFWELDAGTAAVVLSETVGAESPPVVKGAVPAGDPVVADYLLERLLTQGSRPALIVLEISPETICYPTRWVAEHAIRFFTWGDVAAWVPEIVIAGQVRKVAAARFAPIHLYRRELLTWMAGAAPPYLRVAPPGGPGGTAARRAERLVPGAEHARVPPAPTANRNDTTEEPERLRPNAATLFRLREPRKWLRH